MAAALRDWDVLTAIRDTLAGLDSTFDRVQLSAPPSDWGASAFGQIAVVQRTGFEDLDQWDDSPGVSIPRKVTFTVTIYVREADPELRDREADQLGNATQNALDGTSIGGLTLPMMTKLRMGKDQRARPPEKQLVMTGEFVYMIEGFGGHDTTE